MKPDLPSVTRDSGGVLHQSPRATRGLFTGTLQLGWARRLSLVDRRVPITAETTALLRDYLVEHPRRHEAAAPLFPGTRLTTPRPTGRRATLGTPGAATTGAKEAASNATAKDRARRQADALAAVSPCG